MAIFDRLPIAELEQFRKNMATQGRYYRIRYRGPRARALGDNRPRSTQQSTCLKQFATHFSVYRY